MKRIIIIIGFILLATSLFAHSREGHTKDWVACLGIDVQASKDLTEVWKEIQKGIDDYSDDYRTLRNNHPWFNITKGGYPQHRLLFHWGMNNDPKHLEALTYKIKENLKDFFESEYRVKYLISGELRNEDFAFLKRLGFSESLLIKKTSEKEETARQQKLLEELKSKLSSIKQNETADFYRDIIEMQRKRNSNMIAKTQKEFFGNNSALREDAAALATILYDIHILGDYSTTDTAPLQRIDGIYGIQNDIIERGLRRLISAPDRDRIIQAFKKETNSSGLAWSYKANKILKVLKKFLPQILWKRRNTLEKNGIIISKPMVMTLYEGEN